MAEFGLWWWREKQLLVARKALSPSETIPEIPVTSFGSIITVSGPLLSFPSLSIPSPTPLLAVLRPPPSELALTPDDVSAFKRGFQVMKEVKYERQDGGMPESQAEWEPIMRFWSERLERRVGEEAGLYEVMNGPL